MLTFSIADGAFPSNEGRGYVLRRVLRRAARYGRKLQMHEPFIFKLVDSVIGILGDSFPEIEERKEHIERVIYSEEEHFNRTLDRGLEIFAKIKDELYQKKKTIIPGHDVFKLYDTFGFPLDLTQILATEANLKIDMQSFDKEMKKQQERARNASKFKTGQIPIDSWITLLENKKSNFVGYEEDAIETHIVKYSIQKDSLNIILKDTPFYAESGGQVGDKGIIATDEFELEVFDTQKEDDEIIHVCRLPENFSLKSDRVFAEINTQERRQTEKNHTATHLLHASLRKVLGVHVQQAGSLVDPLRLRFDFTHNSKLTDQEIIKIERLINQKIQEDIPLEILFKSYAEAKKDGAMALFGEKYEDTVRTIRIKDYSFELCGGTHVKQTGQIGLFILTYESSIASGIRRIEAFTGEGAINYTQNTRHQLRKLSDLLNAKDFDLITKTQEILQNKREIEKELAKINAKMLTADIDSIISSADMVNGVKIISKKLENSNIDQLKELGDKIREKSNNTVALLGTITNKKLAFVCIVSDDLIKAKNLNAGDLVRKVAQIAGGSGGGRPHMATAGGKDAAKFDTAMEEIKKII
jgi:alanyl-tRNA synthetase